jgi:DNA polymerase elongation subunit (family B)
METMERFARKEIDYDGDSIEFQALEWNDSNQPKTFEDDMDVDECEIPEEYVIRSFGVTREGHSVCLSITDFTPFFYVKVPEAWGKNNANLFMNNLINLTGYYNGRAYNPLKKWGQYLLREKCLIQRKKDFYGFSGEKQFKFLRLTFNNSAAMKKFVYAINAHNDAGNKTSVPGINFKIKLYESNLDPILKFMHIRDAKPTGWISAKNIKVIEGLSKISRCQIEASCSWTDVSCDIENESNARILQASFDIEVYSIDGSFPIPGIKENCVTQIATAFKYFGDASFYVKHIITLKDCAEIVSEDDVPVIVESYSTEKEVLLAWKRLVNTMDPDILYTYNGDQFDCNYLNERAKITRCSEEFLDLSKLKETSSVLKEAHFSSSAYGTSNYRRLSIPGRINFDLLIYIQREYKENSYKLDSIAEKYLGQKKNDMTPQQMFDFFASGDPEKIAILAKYCIKDTLLPQLLVDKLHILQNQISMSNVTYVPIKYLIERGQSIKAFSQILRETRKAGYLVPVLERSSSDEEAESFEGATVLAPDTGAYFSPVTVCDFASLYPSIIRAHNLCFSTIVLSEEYNDLPNTEYNTIEWEEQGGVKHSFKYCKSTEGILPKLLKELTESRKKYKKLMKEAEDPFSKEIYNKCQLAVKVSMNSIYGFLAAPMLTCKGIAATVTAYGRLMIADTKKFMEEEYPCSVAVYGDSVTGRTPLLLEKDGEIHIETIQSIFDKNNKVDYPGFKILDGSDREEKEYSSSKFRIWTDKGWQNIKKVIRHKCDKKIYNVLTHTGYVEVTEDHSLLDENTVIIKPKDCAVGTKLLSSYPGKFNESCSSISNGKAFIYGFFYGDGSCGFYKCNSGNKYSWALNNADLDVLDNLRTLLRKEYPSSDPIVYDTLASSGVYKLTVNNQKNMVNEFRDKFYDSDKNKKVPTEILNSDNEIIQSFFDGYWAADGCRKDKESSGCERFDNKGQIGSAGLYYLMKKLGYKVSLNTRKDKEEVIRLTLTKKTQRKVSNEIKKLESREHVGYVYDIETDSGRFQAGVGDIIVKNTDSVFVKFKTKSTELFNSERDRIYNHVVVTDGDKNYLKKLKSKCIEESKVIGKEAAERATEKLFKMPISLEYEKVYCPLLLLSKKRYIGELYSENSEKMDYLDNKGVVLKRRDNFELLRICYQKIVDIFVEDGEKGLDKALDYIRYVIDDIKNGTVDKDLLVVTKTLKGPYKSLNIPHVVLSRTLAERDPGNAPRSNDRIPYIFIDNGWTKSTTPQYTKVEDPAYAKLHGLPVDTEYYIKYLMNPICEILELFMEKPEEMFKKITMEYRKTRLARLKKQ